MKINKLASLAVIALTLAVLVLTAGHALAATLVVDDDGTFDSTTNGCDGPDAALTSIQAAITAATAGDTILVCPGAYPERLTISKSLNLQGAQSGVDPTPGGARTTPAAESIVDTSALGGATPHVTVEINGMVHDVTIAGFTLIGDPTSGIADTSIIRFGGSAGPDVNDRITI